MLVVDKRFQRLPRSPFRIAILLELQRVECLYRKPVVSVRVPVGGLHSPSLSVGKPSQFGLHSDTARYLLKFTDFAIGSLVLRMRTARQ